MQAPKAEIRVAEHPSFVGAAFRTEFPRPLADSPSPDWLVAGLALEADAPLERSGEVRRQVRDLLRVGGYKPTGRGKPAAEYLVRSAGEGKLGTINAAVDACNVVSLHSALPISVVDLDLAVAPFHIDLAEKGTGYVFNPTGQTIDLSGLLCLFDAQGACANGVKDSQRTKTHPGTRRSLSVIWAARGLEERLAESLRWYVSLLERCGARTVPLALRPGSWS